MGCHSTYKIVEIAWIAEVMAIDVEIVTISVPEKLPFLEAVCWQTENVYQFTPEQMLSRYEQGWKYWQLFDKPEGEELNFLRKLAKYYQSWLQTDLWPLG
jgi:hypothetical protein